jgi:hypothetical protein
MWLGVFISGYHLLLGRDVYSSVSPTVMVNFLGGSFPSSYFWTYSVPIAGGLPSASSWYRIVFLVSLSRVKVRVCLSMCL